MKILSIIIIIFLFQISNAQSVIEYYLDTEVNFKVYLDNENKLRKITNSSDFKSSTPEELVRSYFFATSNNILSDLYSNDEQFIPKEESHFMNIRKTSSDDMYVKLLHKSNYTIEGDEVCYIMFIAKIKDINFPFPTLLALTRLNGNWVIKRRSNQQKLRDCLMMFKPCVLSNLIEGKSEDLDINKILLKTKSDTGYLDYSLLFNELVIIQNNGKLSSKLTMSQNSDCSEIAFEEIVTGKNSFTTIFEKVSFNKIIKRDHQIISQIKANNDSIVLTSKLEFQYIKKKYSAIKFQRIKESGEITNDFLRLDKNPLSKRPAKNLIFLFQNLDIDIFSDLSPSLNKKSISESVLFKNSRGVYEILNLTKLHNLFLSNRELFKDYL